MSRAALVQLGSVSALRGFTYTRFSSTPASPETARPISTLPLQPPQCENDDESHSWRPAAAARGLSLFSPRDLSLSASLACFTLTVSRTHVTYKMCVTGFMWSGRLWPTEGCELSLGKVKSYTQVFNCTGGWRPQPLCCSRVRCNLH